MKSVLVFVNTLNQGRLKAKSLIIKELIKIIFWETQKLINAHINAKKMLFLSIQLNEVGVICQVNVISNYYL